MPATRMIGMAMRHQRARRRNRGIDPRIGGGHVDSVGVRFDPVAERGHPAYMIGMAGGSTARSRHPGCVPGSNPPRALLFAAQLGSASCRERLCQYGYISGRAVSLKTKNKRRDKL